VRCVPGRTNLQLKHQPSQPDHPGSSVINTRHGAHGNKPSKAAAFLLSICNFVARANLLPGGHGATPI
jgi:hypothetical protein